MMTFGYPFKEYTDDTASTTRWAILVTCTETGLSEKVYTTGSKRELVCALKRRGYKFDGSLWERSSNKIIWSDYPKYACYIGLTAYGLAVCSEICSDPVTLLGNGKWACEYPQPKYIQKALNQLAKRFNSNTELYKYYNFA